MGKTEKQKQAKAARGGKCKKLSESAGQARFSRNAVILLACCLLSCLCLLVWLSACLYLDDEMTLLYFPSFPLLPLLYCTSSTVDSSPSLVYCAAVLCILLVIATRNATSTRRQGHRRHTRRRGWFAWQVTMTMGVKVTIHEEERLCAGK